VILGTLAQRAGLGVWPLRPGGWALLGASTGLCLMLGELPNSFVKRQLGVEPGSPPRHRAGRIAAALADRLDSIVGALIGARLVVELSWGTALACLLLGRRSTGSSAPCSGRSA